MRHFNKISIEMTAFTLRQNLLHMQHHFLCNISYVAIAMSMGKSLKYTTNVYVVHVLYMCCYIYKFAQLHGYYYKHILISV